MDYIATWLWFPAKNLCCEVQKVLEFLFEYDFKD